MQNEKKRAWNQMITIMLKTFAIWRRNKTPKKREQNQNWNTCRQMPKYTQSPNGNSKWREQFLCITNEYICYSTCFEKCVNECKCVCERVKESKWMRMHVFVVYFLWLRERAIVKSLNFYEKINITSTHTKKTVKDTHCKIPNAYKYGWIQWKKRREKR